LICVCVWGAALHAYTSGIIYIYTTSDIYIHTYKYR